MDEYLSVIKLFGCSFNPRGWQMCQGQILAIATNTALFSLLGTTYGGNGQTTFALPDLRGRVAVGMGNGPGLPPVVQGEVAGNASVTLLTTQMPAHTHTATFVSGTAATTAILSAESTPANAQNPANKCLASGTNIYAAEDPAQNRQMSPTCITATTTISAVVMTNGIAGNSQPIDIRTPYLGLNYCICTEGIFPSRN